MFAVIQPNSGSNVIQYFKRPRPAKAADEQRAEVREELRKRLGLQEE